MHGTVLSSLPSSDPSQAGDASGTPIEASRPARVRSADFFRHYNRLLIATGLSVFLLTAGFLAYQMVLNGVITDSMAVAGILRIKLWIQERSLH